MSIADEIEDGIQMNAGEAFKKMSEELHKKFEEAQLIAKTIDVLEDNLKEHKDKLRRMQEEELPEMMSQMGVNSVEFTDGNSAKIETSIHCGIPKNSEEEAFKWLQEHNLGDLIKNEMKIKFGRKEGNLLGDVKDTIEKLGLNYEQKSSVHNMSLKAVVKEQMSSANPLPADLFGIFIRRAVNVTKG